MKSSNTLVDLIGKPNDTEFKSSLIDECIRLHSVPLKDLTAENLRVLIDQCIGLEYVIPLALDKLEINPLESGKMYTGDLLLTVSKVSVEFWQEHSDLNNRLVEVKIELEGISEMIVEELLPSLSSVHFM